MAKVEIEVIWNEFLKTEEVKNLVDGICTSCSNRCGAGYNHDIKLGSTRYYGSYYTDSTDAMRDNAKNNTLLRNMHT